ncbi:MAG: hypothetical protein LBC99_11085, partial [Spirochaetota bacterium]|nr:hypothetical protein [Spirochaetota bacterium]
MVNSEDRYFWENPEMESYLQLDSLAQYASIPLPDALNTQARLNPELLKLSASIRLPAPAKLPTLIERNEVVYDAQAKLKPPVGQPDTQAKAEPVPIQPPVPLSPMDTQAKLKPPAGQQAESAPIQPTVPLSPINAQATPDAVSLKPPILIERSEVIYDTQAKPDAVLPLPPAPIAWNEPNPEPPILIERSEVVYDTQAKPDAVLPLPPVPIAWNEPNPEPPIERERNETRAASANTNALDAQLLQAISLAKTGDTKKAGQAFAKLIPCLAGKTSILRLALPCLYHARELDALKMLIASVSADSSPGGRTLLRDLIRDVYADEEYGIIAELYDAALPLRAGFDHDDWYRFCIALAYFEREEEARAACMQSLGLNEMPASWASCIDILCASGRADKAIYPLAAQNVLARSDPQTCLDYCAALPSSAMGSRLCLVKARCLMLAGSHHEALALLEKLNYDAKVCGEKQYLEGCIHFYGGRKKEAYDCFRKASESGFYEKNCWRFLGDISTEEGEHEQA